MPRPPGQLLSRAIADTLLTADQVIKIRRIARQFPESITIGDSLAVSGSGGPSAPQDLTLTNQEPNAASLSWTAPVAGVNSIANVKLYRYTIAKDGSIASTTSFTLASSATSYRDTTATNTTIPGNDPEPYIPATTYRYAVSAIDSVGMESALNEACAMWMFQAGADNFTAATANNLNYNGTTSSRDTTVHQSGSTASIKVTGGTGAFQPISGGPFLTNMSPAQYCAEIGAFNYYTFDVLWWANNVTISISLISRVSPPSNSGTGDCFNQAQVVVGGSSSTAFGPAAVSGVWSRYKIPMWGSSNNAACLQIGYGSFAGSVSGTNLTVSGSQSGRTINGSGYIFGPGVTTGSESTPIAQPFVRATASGNPFGNPSNGGTGTYVIGPSQGSGSGTYTIQRTNYYKNGFVPSTAGPTYYLDNIGWGFDPAISGP